MSALPAYWQDKVALVTGGSSGLGLAIAESLARRKAKVVIAARRPEPLESAAAELRRYEPSAMAVPADVTRQEDVDRLIEETIARFGKLDMLVNCAGRSTRGDILSTTAEDFEQLLDLNFIALVRCTLAAAPHLLQSKGHLVNIASLAAKSAGHHLGAYPATKFAVAAYTQQLRNELEPQGLHVLLVCPGPIAREEVRTYGAEQMPALPPRASQPGGGVKLTRLSADKLAAAILKACERRKAELVMPAASRLLFALAQLSPRLGDWLLKKWS